MSEYQYYEFLAIDRPLTEDETSALRNISSRANITSTSFVNVYHWGDLKADPLDLMKKYFDAFTYVANWGTHRLMLRFPGRLFDARTIRPYQVKYALSVEEQGEHLVVEFVTDRENEGSWEKGEGWLSSLVPIRADLLHGDLRPLYLGWLLGVQNNHVKKTSLEPPIPAGMAELTAPLTSLAQFLWLDECLIEAAIQGRTESLEATLMADKLRTWIHSLPEREKERLLARFATGEALHPRAELLQRFRTSRRGESPPANPKRRTVGEILAVAEELRAIRRRETAEREARERARREKEEAIAREKHLDSLVGRESRIWTTIEALIASKQPKKYDQAVVSLRDLRDLAARAGTQNAFAARLKKLREQHAKKPSFLKRLNAIEGT